MEEKKSVWPFAMTYGLALGMISVILSIVFYIVSPMDPEKGTGGGWIQTVITLLLEGIFVYWAVSKFRDESNDGFISYGRSLGTTMAMAIPTAILTAIYVYIFFAFIDPDFLSKIAEVQANKMAERGLSDEQIEKQMAMMNKFSSPMMYSLLSPLGVGFQLLIIGLIISIFTRREQASQAE